MEKGEKGVETVLVLELEAQEILIKQVPGSGYVPLPEPEKEEVRVVVIVG
ncbi:photosystem reaction center subunit H [Corchorus capsularis]|uniref:Photosystem reaction center subunit H n=1 Tax=Corchorus capsularis TaxID=210143 RepID=A0A1R3ICT8_COCAP|nr:photosystem reaction center subunit H [Corchorus capsularis]